MRILNNPMGALAVVNGQSGGTSSGVALSSNIVSIFVGRCIQIAQQMEDAREAQIEAMGDAADCQRKGDLECARKKNEESLQHLAEFNELSAKQERLGCLKLAQLLD